MTCCNSQTAYYGINKESLAWLSLLLWISIQTRVQSIFRHKLSLIIKSYYYYSYIELVGYYKPDAHLQIKSNSCLNCTLSQTTTTINVLDSYWCSAIQIDPIKMKNGILIQKILASTWLAVRSLYTVL
jgi:hypothetical protein